MIPSLFRVIQVVNLGKGTWKDSSGQYLYVRPSFQPGFIFSRLICTANPMDEFLGAYIEVPIGVISLCVPSWLALIKRAHSDGTRSLFTSKRYYRPPGEAVARQGLDLSPCGVTREEMPPRDAHEVFDGVELIRNVEDCETGRKWLSSESSDASEDREKDVARCVKNGECGWVKARA